MTDTTPSNAIAYLVYDGDCPLCSQYARMLRLRESVGPLELVSARDEHPVVDSLIEEGFDLDEGMAFIHLGSVYFGDDAIARMAMLSSPISFFNRLNASVFKRPRLAAAMYPLMKAGRRLSLWIMRRSLIRSASVSQAR